MSDLTAYAVDAEVEECPTKRTGMMMDWQEPKAPSKVRWIIQPRPDGAWFDLRMPGPMPCWWYRLWQRVLFGWKWEKVKT